MKLTPGGVKSVFQKKELRILQRLSTLELLPKLWEKTACAEKKKETISKSRLWSDPGAAF